MSGLPSVCSLGPRSSALDAYHTSIHIQGESIADITLCHELLASNINDLGSCLRSCMLGLYIFL